MGSFSFIVGLAGLFVGPSGLLFGSRGLFWDILWPHGGTQLHRAFACAQRGHVSSWSFVICLESIEGAQHLIHAFVAYGLPHFASEFPFGPPTLP